jgi:hypothetical protein
MRAVIDAITIGSSAALTEIRRLDRTRSQQATDMVAFFDCPAMQRPAEAIDCVERHRGSDLGRMAQLRVACSEPATSKHEQHLRSRWATKAD